LFYKHIYTPGNVESKHDIDIAVIVRRAIFWMTFVHILFVVRFLLQIVKECRKGKMPVFVPFLLEDCTCFISSICTLQAIIAHWKYACYFRTAPGKTRSPMRKAVNLLFFEIVF